MEIAGVLPEDAPDPRLQVKARLRDLYFPLMTLAPQPSVEDTGAVSISEGTDEESRSHLSVSITYALWRPHEPIP